MIVYWDTSALIWYYVRGRVSEIGGFTRPHSLAEAFSALTGAGFEITLPNGAVRRKRLSASVAETILWRLHAQLRYVNLTAEEVMRALQGVQSKGVQGGRVHDLLHSIAAEKCGAQELWTLDQNDFGGLGSVPVKNPALLPDR